MAGPTQSPSAETQDGQGPQEPVEEEYAPEDEAEADVPGETSKPPGLGPDEDECYSLEELKNTFLYSYDDIETFEEFEERVAQGCALSLPDEREAIEAYAMELIGIMLLSIWIVARGV